MRIVLAPKSLSKQSRNHSTTHPKNVPKTHRNSTPLFIDFASEMISQMRSKSLTKSTPGALRGHMGHKEALNGGPGPSGVQLSSISAPNLNVFQYYLRLPFEVPLSIKPTQTDHKAHRLSPKTTTGDGPICRRLRQRPTTTGDDHGRRVTW